MAFLSKNLFRLLKNEFGNTRRSCYNYVKKVSLRSEAQVSSKKMYFCDLRPRITSIASESRKLCTRRGQDQLSDKQPEDEDVGNQFLDFPGGKVELVPEMNFLAESSTKRVPCYRVLNQYGYLIGECDIHQQVNKDLALRIYKCMVTLQVMDTILFEAQRQGRISFYMACNGEEAINVASAAALTLDDVIFPQYREQGVLMWRGFTLREFVNQCYGNSAGHGKGRQMPVHYGSKQLNYFTVSSPIATQLPHAVGAAYSLKMDKKEACAVTYFGDGGSSEGDFHAAMNFAAVLEVPVLFICRNNGWAISTPCSEQFKSDGVVVKGLGYGIKSIRVDGTDALAMYNAVCEARKIAVRENKPILIEALTYRISHHSTSDDSTKYRRVDEIEFWRNQYDPASRFRKWLDRNGWWTDKDEKFLRAEVRNEVIKAIQTAEQMEKPSLACLFSDVYDNLPANLWDQEKHIRKAAAQHPECYPSDIPIELDISQVQ
eukprot:TRINITY_DN1716_c0_g1_i1.p1 TRINITY_DN1716_c0_g1~~TRINITY_DN1716_c0_g1_i1.p1  ORF type:complete len:506 (-),score=84.70 TRINITY_DN1716_c0_g1_i1:401-1864(-)